MMSLLAWTKRLRLVGLCLVCCTPQVARISPEAQQVALTSGQDSSVGAALPAVITIESGGGQCPLPNGCWGGISVTSERRVLLEDAEGEMQANLTDVEWQEYESLVSSPLFVELASAAEWSCPRVFDFDATVSVTWADGSASTFADAEGCLHAGIRAGTVLSRVFRLFTRFKYAHRTCPDGTGPTVARRYICA